MIQGQEIWPEKPYFIVSPPNSLIYLCCAPCHSQNLRLFPEHIRPVHSLSTQGTDKCFSSDSGKRSVSGGVCASNALLCGTACAWCRFFHWHLGGPLACPALGTRFSASCVPCCTRCPTPASLLSTPGAFSLGCVLCRVLPPVPGPCAVLPLGALTGWQACLWEGMEATACAHLK